MPDPRQFARTLFHIPEEPDKKVDDGSDNPSPLLSEWEEADIESGKPKTPPPKPVVYAYDARNKLARLLAKRVLLDPQIKEARAMQTQAYNAFMKTYNSRAKVGWPKTARNEAWWKDWRAQDDYWGGKLHEAERQARFLDEYIGKMKQVLAEAEEREAHLPKCRTQATQTSPGGPRPKEKGRH